MKKLLPLLLATAMLFSIIGCRANGDDTQPTETQSPTSQATLSSQTSTSTQTAPEIETTIPGETTTSTATTATTESPNPANTSVPTESSTPKETTLPSGNTGSTVASTPADPTLETTVPETTTAPTTGTKPSGNSGSSGNSGNSGSSGNSGNPGTAAPTTEPITEPVTEPTTEPTAVIIPPAGNLPVVIPTQPGPSTCEHTYKATVLRTSTCSKAGSIRYVCSKCGTSYTEAAQLAEHTYKAATCTAPETCTVCGHTKGDALGHDFKDYVCNRCGASDPSAPRTWSISINAKNGKPLSGVTVKIYSDDTLKELVATGVTDQYGVLSLEMATKWTYCIVLSGYGQNYTAAKSYSLYSDDLAITLSSSSDQNLSGTKLKVGSTVSDFTVYDIDGNRYNLTDMLEEKELVILNFWYVNCSPCKAEFPHIESVYQEYGDRIEILAMDHYEGDSLTEIRQIREDYGISFPTIKENLGFDTALNITGYPTTVIIDRTGTIVYIKTGGFSSEKELRDLLEQYL